MNKLQVSLQLARKIIIPYVVIWDIELLKLTQLAVRYILAEYSMKIINDGTLNELPSKSTAKVKLRHKC